MLPSSNRVYISFCVTSKVNSLKTKMFPKWCGKLIKYAISSQVPVLNAWSLAVGLIPKGPCWRINHFGEGVCEGYMWSPVFPPSLLLANIKWSSILPHHDSWPHGTRMRAFLSPCSWLFVWFNSCFRLLLLWLQSYFPKIAFCQGTVSHQQTWSLNSPQSSKFWRWVPPPALR